jgi:hypothetical protein
MPIAFDAATDGGNNGGGSNSLSFAHTCTGSDRILFVGIAGDVAPFGADDITGVTYNGVAMEFVGKRFADELVSRGTYLYQLEAPASGSNNVVVSSTSAHYLLAGAVSYTGAAQSGQPDNSTTNLSADTATSLTTSLTTVADNCWTALVINEATSGAPGAGTGSTRRTYDAAFQVWGMFDSNAAITPAGSYSMTTTRGAGIEAIAHVMASFSPFVSARRFILGTH